MVITVQCPSCSTSFPVDTDKVPEGGVYARCSECAGVFFVDRPEEVEREPAPAPGPEVTEAAEPAVASQRDDAPPMDPAWQPAAPETSWEPPPVEAAWAPPPPETAWEPPPPETAWEPPPAPEPAAPAAFELEATSSPPAPEPAAPAAFEFEVTSSPPAPEPVAPAAFEFEAMPPSTAPEPVAPATDGISAEPMPITPEPDTEAFSIPAPPAPAAPPPRADAPRETAPAAPLPVGSFSFGRRDPHDKAKRLARVLVSDMIMYNPERHSRALEAGSLKEDFGDEIQKSWEEYVGQVGDAIAGSTSYFNDALNDILARGHRLFP